MFDVRKRSMYRLIMWDQIPTETEVSFTVPKYEEQLVKQYQEGKVSKNNWYIKLSGCFNKDTQLTDRLVKAFAPIALNIPRSIYAKWEFANCNDESILEDDAVVMVFKRFEKYKRMCARWNIERIERADKLVVESLPEVHIQL